MPIDIKKIESELPLVSIIGRTNVGKSTLFNTIAETKQAFISNVPGTTRDRNFNTVDWRGYTFRIADTAGLDIAVQKQADQFELDVLKQADIAIDNSAVILLVVDIKDGILPQDRDIALKIKKSGRPHILVINKADNPRLRQAQYEFTQLGFEHMVAISAKNGSGVGDLLDIVTKLMDAQGIKPIEEELPFDFRLSLIGKPNAGKSTLINSLLGEEYCAVSSTPHTTREPQDVIINCANELNIKLVDTAGIRRKFRKGPGIEQNSVDKSLETIENSDICLFLLDGSQPLDSQDKQIAGTIKESRNASLIIVVNKSDLLKQQDQTKEDYEKMLRIEFPWLAWVPVVFISAKNKTNLKTLLNLVTKVFHERNKQVDDSILDKMVKRIIKKHRTGANRKDITYVYGIKQVATNPPHITIFVKKKVKMPFGLMRFIANSIREKFKFVATPINVSVREIRQK